LSKPCNCLNITVSTGSSSIFLIQKALSNDELWVCPAWPKRGTMFKTLNAEPSCWLRRWGRLWLCWQMWLSSVLWGKGPSRPPPMVHDIQVPGRCENSASQLAQWRF
jgi:hypothetical protein